MSTIKNVRITIVGGTEEEKRELTDAFTLVLVEHGVSIEDMREWDGPVSDG